MSSVGEYKTVEDVISDLNVMIVEAPIPTHIAMILAKVPIGGWAEARKLFSEDRAVEDAEDYTLEELDNG